jgi:adenylate cyclase
MRQLRRKAGRPEGEPLKPEDWEVIWRLHEYGFNRAVNKLFFALPRSPRCGGFTARFEGADPEEASALLRRFYRCAEDVLFPKAVIDKLIGDEVMALYLPYLKRDFPREEVPTVMLQHARGLLRAVGYGSGEEPFVEMGIGLDFGDAFVGNIGQRALYDFTAVGDVVNTASRLQGTAAGGEIMLSERVARGLLEPVGTPVELTLKGKSEPQSAYRVSL